ncbi:MAG TPA: hypothetical protein O0X70_08005 [Methanocorpusculum sp.]|nr:hypothetical protein [Methanocorpusculum sp.]
MRGIQILIIRALFQKHNSIHSVGITCPKIKSFCPKIKSSFQISLASIWANLNFWAKPDLAEPDSVHKRVATLEEDFKKGVISVKDFAE